MKKILIITERRADFSRFKPIIKLIQKDKKLDYQLIVTGIHLVKNMDIPSMKSIKKNLKFFQNLKCLIISIFSKMTVQKWSGLLKSFLNISKLIKKSKPDLILSGFDIAANFAISVAGAHMNVPVAHIQGGEVSGTIDESLRHATSKFSNFHFTANKETKNRLIRLGEIPKNIYPVGCPSIDALLSEKLLSKQSIIRKFKIDLKEKFLLVIQHPVTSEQNTLFQIKQTLSVIKNSNMQHLVVFPNNDAGSKKILQEIKKANINYVPTLTLTEYRTLLSGKMILLGNSSSGVHEAASFKVPVVNIGSRQNGRYKPSNVINVNYNKKEIAKAIKKVNSKSFYKKIKKIKNPYGDGKSAIKIIKIIKKLNLKNFNTQKN